MPFTIAIAGCGPAGLAAAILLNAQGHSVTIFDQFDNPGPVGSGLMIQPSGMAVLSQLDLGVEVARRGARIDGLKGLEENGRLVLNAPYSALGHPGAFGIGIHRASLFDVLYQAAKRDRIAIETGRTISGQIKAREGSRLSFADGSQSDIFDLIVDASGWQSVFDAGERHMLDYGALWASLPVRPDDPYASNLLEQRYRRANQMVGVLPIGQRHGSAEEEVAFFWSLRRDQLAAWQDTPLERWKAEVLALWPETERLLDRISDRSQLTFASYSHRTAKRVADDRFIAIGDSWHSASPQLGQGANMALLDAWSLARGLEHGRTLHDGLRLAVSWRQDHVALYQWVTALFTPLYQSDSSLYPMIRDHFMAPISGIWPASRIQAALMSGLFGFPLPVLGLTLPDYSAIASVMSARASSLSQ